MFMLRGSLQNHHGTCTLATLPTAHEPGETVYVSDGQKAGENADAGTGALYYYDGTAWRPVAATINHLGTKAVADLGDLTPVAGNTAYASDGRKAGEGAGVGTGVFIFYDGSDWIAVDTGAAVAA